MGIRVEDLAYQPQYLSLQPLLVWVARLGCEITDFVYANGLNCMVYLR